MCWGQRKEQRQGRTGELYISFRSSRVWSSILCVQRCSSLVHFSLSSKSSIVFSSLATDLSANSVRASASLSLSVGIFISCSYLSSFCEYFSWATVRHFRFRSISLNYSSFSWQRDSASSTRSSVCSKSTLVITNLRATSSYFLSASSAMCLASVSWISWSSNFSSSFRVQFSITFLPLSLSLTSSSFCRAVACRSYAGSSSSSTSWILRFKEAASALACF